ncbi:MAG: hypothetical protein OXB98_04700 [Bryobacterales bacterium]|nr:hypothetical protein [Bryobacterales bacterium]
MKLTAKDADLLIRDFTTRDPGPDVRSRVRSHKWSFNPRSSDLTFLLRLYHELDQVLYGTLTNFLEVSEASDADFEYFVCNICASRKLVLPYFVATRLTEFDVELCCLCAEALGADMSREAHSVCSSLREPRWRGHIGRILLSVRSSVQFVDD